MQTHANRNQGNKSQSFAAAVAQKRLGRDKSTFQFVDIRPGAVAQQELQEMAGNSAQAKQTAQLQVMANRHTSQRQRLPLQEKGNNTGLPSNLKPGIENLSGYSMDDVKVYRNSDKPARLQAYAYAQGTDIYLGPGQEEHLPHEAWHVVQQKQGRVRPTMQIKGKVNVNDDVALEKEADVMGKQAKEISQTKVSSKRCLQATQHYGVNSQTIQLSAAADLTAAQQNQAYLVNETENLDTAGDKVYAAINGAPASGTKDKAAAGLRYYWQTMIDGFDGKKAEMYEAELLATSHIPILSTNDLTDPDVRIETGGQVEATEVKTINSDNTGNVNTLIKGADIQLGKRLANVRKIKIRIESVNNLWPDARYNNLSKIARNKDLKDWLAAPGTIPNLANADEIQIEGINIPYGGGGKRNFSAEIKGNGEVKKTSASVWE